MRITLQRHAPTEGNLSRRYVGVTDEPLCEQGITLARLREPDASVMRVYTSKLRRTQQTARLLYPKARILRVADLGEMDFGLFEGRSANEMEHDSAYRSWVEGGCVGTCPEGEDMASFSKRCVDAAWEIIASAAERGSESEVFVVHGGTIMAIMAELAVPIKELFDWHVGYCGGFVVEYDDAGIEPHHRTPGSRPLRLLDSIRS